MKREFNPYDFFTDFNETAIKNYKEKLVKEFHRIDEDLFSYTKKSNPTYKPKGYKDRKLISIFGEIKLKLHRYKYWDNEKYNSKTNSYGKWRYKVLFLSHIKLKKYQRLAHDLRLKILNMIGDGLRHKDILLACPQAELTTQTISNVIKRETISDHIDENNIVKVDVTENENRVHIVLDDTFLKAINEKKKKGKFRIRSLTTHTGHNQNESRSYKNVLANKKTAYKMVKIGQGINTSDYCDEILEHINKFYTINENTKFIVGGDGAKWIAEVANILNAEYVLDKFHALRLIKSILSNRTSSYQKLKFIIARYWFSRGEVDKLLNQINSFKDDKLILKQDRIQKVYNYIKRHRKGIESYKYEWCLGVCAEGQISHNYKQTLGYGAKILNEKTLRNMIDLRIAKLNGFKPIETLIDKEMEDLTTQDDFNKTARWYEFKEVDTSNTSHGSTPIIHYGKNNNNCGAAIQGILTN